MGNRYKVQVVWADGEAEYVAEGPRGKESDAVFYNRKDADDCAENFRIGMGGDAESVAVVLVPARKPAKRKR